MRFRVLILIAVVCMFTANAYCAESTQIAVNKTDRVIAGVNGPVKAVTSVDEFGFSDGAWLFDASGEVTKIGQTKLTTNNSKRDSQGRLIQLVETDYDETGEECKSVTQYIYDAKGRLAKTKIETVYDSWTEIYKYNDKNQIISIDRVSPVETMKVTYKYIKFDTKGNWTKAIKTDSTNSKSTITRMITYY